MLDIRVEKCAQLKEKPADETKLGFGQIFTDYMAMVDWDREKGWHDARIVPFGNFSMHPASTCLHYGAEIFEGLKAYRRKDGGVQLFRPWENARRMINSAERLCLPQLPEEDFLQVVTTLVKREEDWVPHLEGTSLYIRPFTFGTDETLGVHAVEHAALRDSFPGGQLLQGRHQSRGHHDRGSGRARGAGRHGIRQVRRQLRGLQPGRRAGRAEGIQPGTVAGRRGAQVH